MATRVTIYVDGIDTVKVYKHLPVERHCETALEAENAKLREHLERLTGLEIQLRDKIRELKESK